MYYMHGAQVTSSISQQESWRKDTEFDVINKEMIGEINMGELNMFQYTNISQSEPLPKSSKQMENNTVQSCS